MRARTSPAGPVTRYEWQVTAIRDGNRVTDTRGLCKHHATAVRHVQAELADAPVDADAYGSMRGVTVTFTNHASGAYQRWGWQAVAVRDENGEVTWFRDRDPDGTCDGSGVGP